MSNNTWWGRLSALFQYVVRSIGGYIMILVTAFFIVTVIKLSIEHRNRRPEGIVRLLINKELNVLGMNDFDYYYFLYQINLLQKINKIKVVYIMPP